MGQYIFSSRLRRAAGTLLGQAGVSLDVMAIGDRPTETLLFRNIAGSIDDVAPGVAAAALSRYDVVLCGLDHLDPLEEGLGALADRAVAAGRTKAIAIRGPLAGVSSQTWRRIERLCTRLGLAVAAQLTEIVDFGQDQEIVFVLARVADCGPSEPWAALKLAIFFEAHSLFADAALWLNRHNATTADAAHAIDVAVIDRLYVAEPFAVGAASANGAASRPVAVQAPTAPAPQRVLSIHFDQMHHPDGKARLRRLARSLALPDQAEIVVRLAAFPPQDWSSIAAELEELGVAVKFFCDAENAETANPGSPEFLAETAVEALVAVYYGAIEPDIAGWDFDLLHVAKTAATPMFSLRISGHKTRNYVNRKDAESAPELLPAVSRAWLEACGAWSDAEIPAGVFQTLVAFYYDRTDWMNKSRSLSLYPVMTLSSLATSREPDHGSATAGRGVSYRTRRRAIAAALKIHALEWGERQGISDLALHCDPIRRRVSVRGPAERKVMKWTLPQDRIRLPL